MNKQHSRFGVLGSLMLHSALFAAMGWAVSQPNLSEPEEQLTGISMEMMAALLEQPQVATDPIVDTSVQENVEEAISSPLSEPIAVKPEEPQTVPIPPEKPQESLKQKPKPVEKKKEKTKVNKPKTKALEKAQEVKTGIVAKAIPNAARSLRDQAGKVSGLSQATNPQGSESSGAKNASANEIAAYKALLKRTLQRQADSSYPLREKMMRRTGTVTLSLSLSPSGQVINVSVLNSSGNSNLDTAAVKAAQSTHLSSSPPKGFPTTLSVPIRFSLIDS